MQHYVVDKKATQRHPRIVLRLCSNGTPSRELTIVCVCVCVCVCACVGGGVDVKSVCTYWTVCLFGLPSDADVADSAAIGVKTFSLYLYYFLRFKTFCHATLCWRGICYGPMTVCRSVRPSVRPSVTSRSSLKRLKVS